MDVTRVSDLQTAYTVYTYSFEVMGSIMSQSSIELLFPIYPLLEPNLRVPRSTPLLSLLPSVQISLCSFCAA